MHRACFNLPQMRVIYFIACSMPFFWSSPIAPPDSIKKEFCPNINFSSKLGPIRDQKHTEWCWASVAADMVGLSQNFKKQISPMQVVHSCEQYISKENKEKSLIKNWNAPQASAIKEIFRNMKGRKLEDVSGYSLFAAYCIGAQKDFCVEAKKLAFSRFGSKRDDKECLHYQPLKPMKVFFRRFPSSGSAAQTLAAWIRSGYPPSIGFSKTFLLREGQSSTRRSDHEALVSGMRWNDSNRSCEFLIRNSWGNSCDQYNPKVSAKCTDEGIWISESQIDEISTHVFKIVPADD